MARDFCESSDYVEIKVLNFSKYNPRKDVKKHSWFRWESDFVKRSRYKMLTSDDIVVLLFALSERSLQKEEDVYLFYEDLETARKISRPKVDRALQVLEKLKIIKVCGTNTLRERHATNVTIRYGTEEKKAESGELVDASTSIENPVPIPPPPEIKVQEETQKQDSLINMPSDRASATKIFDARWSPEFADFVAALEQEGFRPTPAQRRKLPIAFAEWKCDIEAIREFISSKYKEAKKKGRNDYEACRYALTAFIGEAVQ